MRDPKDIVELARLREEIKQSFYYRECRDYWRRQAENLAERWDKHQRAEHNTLSHEQMFSPPRPAIEA